MRFTYQNDEYSMQNLPLITIGKSISTISRILNRGNGSTWPGHVALKGNPNFIKNILSKSKTKVIIVAGTNGKTTTSALIRTGLEKTGFHILQNDSGANLLNGIASTILLNTNASGKLTQDYAIFEVDENALPLILKQITPDYLLLLNLFRDQLDRYGEVNTIAKNWHDAIGHLSEKTTLILNANDPQIAYLGIENAAKNSNTIKHSVKYFGLKGNESKTEMPQHAADSIYCPHCNEKLTFKATYFSHLGDWYCKHCHLKSPEINLSECSDCGLTGTYNTFNKLAATLLLTQLGLTEEQIGESLKDFKPAFGRQEIVKYKEKNVQIFLSKNPTSFNQSFATIKDLKAKTLLIVLNDRIPDGRDISWIWDVDLPEIHKFKQILISGDRVYDMALRIKYEDFQNFQTFENLEEAIETGTKSISENETFFILPTYSAMLDVRKIITGKKIL
jgi:UDP-N-acetylmuramyl tripeptide synthase